MVFQLFKVYFILWKWARVNVFFLLNNNEKGPISIVYNTVEVRDFKYWNGWKC